MLLRPLAATLLLAAAASAAEPTDAERLAASAAKWKETKEACGGNYTYKTIRTSFTGYRAETIITVKNNVVVERRFDTATPVQPGQAAPLKTEWTETGKEIGTHKGAVEARTLDELYVVAKKLVDAEVPANHVRNLAFDKQGILQHCFTRDTRIQDDAPLTGITTIFLTLGKK
jgi:hypothetical protein